MRNEPNEKVKQAVQSLCDELRGGKITGITNAIVDTLLKEDPTLQQAFWSAMLRAQIRYANTPSNQKNELAVELAKDVRALATDKGLNFGLPYV